MCHIEALALICGMSQKGQWRVWGGCARVVSHARGAELTNEDSEVRHKCVMSSVATNLTMLISSHVNELALKRPKCSLFKHSSSSRKLTKSLDPLSIPEPLQVTLRKREVAEDDEMYGERFLLHSGQRGTMHVFSANTELQALHSSEYLVCDETFEMAPSCSYQVYTIHGFVNGEGLLLVWAILPNKTADTYNELFGVVRSALISTFGDIGQMKFFVTDFECAAIYAISHVFPEVMVKGCSFHFRQALMRRVQQG